MADIFNEIDEDVRRERYEQLWKRYGNYVIGAALLVVLATAGVVGWREYTDRQNKAQALRFLNAMEQAQKGDDAGARAGFASLAGDAGAGYATLARLQEAGLLAKAGDTAGAAKVYEQIAGDSRVDQVFREFATILLVQDQVATGEPARLGQMLAPLMNDKSPWRHSATELSALLAQRTGDKAKAKEFYAKLADDLTAPQGMRARATEMLAIIGG
ncbi:MAG: tetratricopeptide repeat protein [Rhodospirillales bacterium]|nr:tetratricopeptide repeat protein [Rhodospirillales bacterium]